MRPGLHQLDQSGAADGDVPTWDNASQLWTPQTPSGGGGGTGYPPGSADVPPMSPNAKDDEFDGTSSVTWTNTPTAAAAQDINTTAASHLYLKGTTGLPTTGIYQSIPASYPFTVKTKLAENTIGSNFSFAGLFFATAAPTNASLMFALVLAFNNGSGFLAPRRESNTMGNAGTYSETLGPTGSAGWAPPAHYFRATFNSATSVDLYISSGGRIWRPIQTGFNPGFTPGVMGLTCSSVTGGTVEALFDFFRVT